MNQSESLLKKTIKPKYWQLANRNLLAKILSEFMYEELIETKIYKLSDDSYEHHLIVNQDLKYIFTASPRIFGNWQVIPESISCIHKKSKTSELQVNEFIANIYQQIGIDGLTVGHLIRELNHTLIADCHLLANPQNLNKHLLNLESAAELEGFMRGHPWFVVNKGRLGFSYDEYLAYAPESSNLQQLSWIAVKSLCAEYKAIKNLDYRKLIVNELGADAVSKFDVEMNNAGLNPEDYVYMPVHDWQWQRQIIQLFAKEIATQEIFWLGKSSDYYLPTQSIRSFNNQSNKSKFQVKLPLSIFNTAVYRGLPNERTRLAPLLTAWIKEICHEDKFLQQQGLVMLGEVASINCPHPIYNQLHGIPYQYQELLGVIWRENVNNYLHADEKVITMAALIHIDNENQPFITELIANSGLTIDEWLAKLFEVVIPPLLHWLYKYGVVYSPHGENTMLVLDDNNCPKRLVIKDFIDDVNISQHDNEALMNLPDELKSVLYRLPDADLAQFIQTGLFVVLYRYLSDILATYVCYPESQFWEILYQVINQYHNEHPEFARRIEEINILKPQFKKLSLNRLRLLEVGYADYAARPKVESTGVVDNPASKFVWGNWDEKRFSIIDKKVS